MSTLKIGVVGYCPPTKFNEADAKALLTQAFDAVVADNPKATDIWVVSGLTDVGVLALAYRAAVARDWKTSGIACAKAKNYDCFPVDTYEIVGRNWGDESNAFLKGIDVLVRIGGGTQSHTEAATFKNAGGEVYAYELDPVTD